MVRQLFVATLSFQGVGAKKLDHHNKCTEPGWWKDKTAKEPGWQIRGETRCLRNRLRRKEKSKEEGGGSGST